ncbi:MAG: iron-sulfur cluster assembly protein [Nanoarchaeota archaeon]|nr:iron-sulfur cluster assembly protein [Nanoarchaeota archaeon]
MITKEELIEHVFKKYEDPELMIDVWTLKIIYDITVEDNKVKILMTFTSPLCPYGPQMVEDLKRMIKEKGVDDVEITITFDPPWKPSDELREMLGV